MLGGFVICAHKKSEYLFWYEIQMGTFHCLAPASSSYLKKKKNLISDLMSCYFP